MYGDSAQGRRPDERRRPQPCPPVVGPDVPLTDGRWARIEPLLPDRTPKRGGRRRDHREVIEAIAFKSRPEHLLRASAPSRHATTAR
ncbi:transposase [Streptomyces mirabilis]|uniref:transposase n=1 Tax=Streptomyces mirabilis TaxID=68239 RepID=UPI0036973E31